MKLKLKISTKILADFSSDKEMFEFSDNTMMIQTNYSLVK